MLSSKIRTQYDQQYLLCETVAYISFIAGIKGYGSPDPFSDLANFVCWAEEFEARHRDEVWGVDRDWLWDVYHFTKAKLRGYHRRADNTHPMNPKK
jgi:hypothetical protein